MGAELVPFESHRFHSHSHTFIMITILFVHYVFQTVLPGVPIYVECSDFQGLQNPSYVNTKREAKSPDFSSSTQLRQHMGPWGANRLQNGLKYLMIWLICAKICTVYKTMIYNMFPIWELN